MTPLNELPWQHVLLLVDAVVSTFGALVYVARGGVRIGKQSWFYTLWDASLVVLLVWGADHLSWQYVVLFLMYSLAVVSGFYRATAKQGEWMKMETDKSAPFFAWLYLIGTCLLILTG